MPSALSQREQLSCEGGVRAEKKSACSLRHKSRCVYGLASTLSLEICFDIQLQEKGSSPLLVLYTEYSLTTGDMAL